MLVFIDESGHPRPSDASTHPVLLATCIKESDMRTLEARLFALRRNHLSGLTLSKEEREGKAVEFLNRRAITNVVSKNSNHNDGRSLLKQTRQQPRARNASWISWRRS